MLMRRSEFLLALIGSSLLILSMFSGQVSAFDTTNAVPLRPRLVAPCDLTDCARESERCQGIFASAFTVAAISSLRLPSGWDGNPVTGIAAAKPPNADGAAKEPPSPKAATNDKWPISNVTAAGEAAEPPRAAMPQPHWSHLPIWGVEAEARGHQIPLPFGIGVNYYHEQQPFNIKNLQVAIPGRPPVSVSNFLQLERVDTTQQSAAARLDVWIFPFLNVYGIVGHTSGKMTGTIQLPAVPILGIPAQTLPLSISYEGPTYGGGVTLAGGLKVSNWCDLTAFIVADANYTITPLTFKEENLFTNTNMKAFILTPRVGLRCKVTKDIHAALWAGAMYQDVSEELAGAATNRAFAFLVTEGPVAPWNALIGGRIEVGKHLDLIVEGGIGTRTSILGGATFRF